MPKETVGELDYWFNYHPELSFEEFGHLLASRNSNVTRAYDDITEFVISWGKTPSLLRSEYWRYVTGVPISRNTGMMLLFVGTMIFNNMAGVSWMKRMANSSKENVQIGQSILNTPLRAISGELESLLGKCYHD